MNDYAPELLEQMKIGNDYVTAPGKTELASRLAERTLELVDIPSESHAEAAVAAHVASVLREGGAEVVDLGDSCVLAHPKETRPRVLLAGTPRHGAGAGELPGAVGPNRVHGLGAADMKAGVAVMIEPALAGVPVDAASCSSRARSCRSRSPR